MGSKPLLIREMKKLVNLGNLGLSDREILQVQVLFSLCILFFVCLVNPSYEVVNLGS